MKRVLFAITILVFCFHNIKAAPTTQAKDVIYSSIGSASFTINWTNGNGVGRCVFVKQTSTAELAIPSDGVNYGANTTFGLGTQIGSSKWYCVYKGSGNSVTVTGLATNTMFRVHVLEYSNTSSNPSFLLGSGSSGNPRFQNTGPSTQASNISFSSIGPDNVTISFTGGNGGNRVVYRTTNLVAADPTIQNGNLFGIGSTNNGWTCVYNSTGTSFQDNGLSPLTTYKYRVFEYNDNSLSATRRIYNLTTATANPSNSTTIDYIAPSTQASGISFSSVSQSSFIVSWTAGNGSASIVFVAQTSSGSPTIIDDNTYIADLNFGNGSEAGTGWYCVYNGASNPGNSYSANVVLVGGSATYRVMVCSYNGSGLHEKYKTTLNENDNIANVFASSSRVWNGASWEGGTPTLSDDAEISGNYDVATNISCQNLTVNTGYTLNVQPGSSVTVMSDLTNNGTINLLSENSMSAPGSLIANGIITNNGTMNANRYITPGTLAADNFYWHLMSSPVTSANVEDVYLLDYVFNYQETINNWASLIQGNSLNMGQGYMVKTLSPKVVSFSGTFNSGGIPVNINNTGADANHGYNLVGNPYPSAIDWNSLSKTNLSGTFWIWDPAINNYTSWDGMVGTFGGSRYIPAMQGFFVKVEEGFASGSIDFTSSAKVHNAQTYMKKGQITPQYVRLEAKGLSQYTDELVVYFNEGANNGFKFFSMDGTVPQIYALSDTTKLSIFKIDPTLFNNNFIVPVGFTCKQDGNYTISLKDFNLSGELDAILVDNSLNDTIDLKTESSYSFAYTAKDAPMRFKLILNAKTNVKIPSISYPDIKVWSNNKKVFINLQTSEKTNIEIYNVEGKKVVTRTLDSGTNSVELNKTGLYLVRVQNKVISYSDKVIVK